MNPDREKNPHAVALGRLGGAKGGLRRAQVLSRTKRRAIARKGGAARAASLTARQRGEAGRAAARARWKRQHAVEWLSRLGAPLVSRTDPRRAPPMPTLEEAFTVALQVAHVDASLARALPVAFWRQRKNLDLETLRLRAEQAGEARTLGLFLDVTAQLSGDEELRHAADALPRVSEDEPPVPFFRPAGGPLERRRDALRTPDFARRRGFVMNMDLELFRSTFEKAAQ